MDHRNRHDDHHRGRIESGRGYSASHEAGERVGGKTGKQALHPIPGNRFIARASCSTPNRKIANPPIMPRMVFSGLIFSRQKMVSRLSAIGFGGTRLSKQGR